MLLASTGQPSFYPEKVEEKEPDNEKEKISDTTNEEKMKDIKNTIDENKINKEEEEKKNIFNFH